MFKNAKIKPVKHLFHDCGYIYVSNIEPKSDEPVTVRLRAEKENVTYAYVEISHNGTDWTAYEMVYEKDDNTGFYEYFKGTIPGQREMFKYRFRAGNDDPANEVYYSRSYIGKEPPVFDETRLQADNCWTLIPGYHTPDWAKGIIWYSVMPDAYYNGDITNDEPVSGENMPNSWNMPQHTLQYKYGGDLKGIEKKLPYIKELGCEAVFMDPIFRSTQNAGYGTEFYKQIENSFGNARALAELASSVHDNGMYYMIDIVLAFVAVRDIWYNMGKTNPLPAAAQDWYSKYHDFFFFTGEEGDTKAYLSSWGGVELNHACEELCKLIYKDPDSYLQYYCGAPFNVDAIRYDCGGALYGIRKNGERIDHVEVVGKMRPYLRAINPEIMMLSEYSLYYSVDKGVWDSRWNLEFVRYALPYMRGEKSESFLFERFDNEMHNVPRAFGHCQYTSISDHDRPRITGVEPYAFRAYQLIQMTEIGAPCIYYGDEIGIERESGTFYSMEWDESNWNYAVLNNTKALTELRKCYSALRTGIIKYISVDDDNHILSFARKDESGLVITAASRNAYEVDFAINVRELGETDGTVFTDWFTGRRYVAVNGYIDVVLPEGGTVLVRGERSASFKGGYRIDNIGGAGAQVTVPRSRALCVTGNGSIGNTDAVTLVSTDVFNTVDISALCKGNGGSGMLLIRADKSLSSAFVGVKFRNSSVTVYSRSRQGARIKRVSGNTVPENSYIRIVRDSGNHFGIYAAKTRGSDWEVLAENIHADIPNHAIAGFTVISGCAIFENINIKYSKDSILCDRFTDSHSAMFNFSYSSGIKYLKSGMSVTPENGSVRLLTNSYDEDWTFKSEFKINAAGENDFAGIVSAQDDDIYVTAGRMRQNGNPVFFIGRASAGKLTVYHAVPDTMPDRKATVQLQRTGTAYSAVYSYGGRRWKAIGKNIIANMCAERVGLTVHGGNALFSYACFGDSVNDGKSYNTPRTPVPMRLSFENMDNTLIQPAYEIVCGDWDYAAEGYVQQSYQRAQMGISNRQYKDFKIDGTYVIDSGDGFVGFEFGKPDYNTDLGDGILFSLNSDRTIALTKSGKAIATADISTHYNDGIKLAVENRNGVFVVFAGQNGEPVMVINGFEKTQGCVSYFTQGVIGHINNYLTASYDADFYFSGAYEKPLFSGNTAEKRWLNTPCFISPFGVGVTDFVLCAKFRVKNFPDAIRNPFVGFYICSPEAKFTENKALAVVFDRNYCLALKNGDHILAKANIDKSREVTGLMVVKKGTEISVYANGGNTPVIEYTADSGNGGAVSLYSNMTAVVFEDMTLCDLQPDSLPESAANYKAWMRQAK